MKPPHSYLILLEKICQNIIFRSEICWVDVFFCCLKFKISSYFFILWSIILWFFCQKEVVLFCTHPPNLLEIAYRMWFFCENKVRQNIIFRNEICWIYAFFCCVKFKISPYFFILWSIKLWFFCQKEVVLFCTPPLTSLRLRTEHDFFVKIRFFKISFSAAKSVESTLFFAVSNSKSHRISLFYEESYSDFSVKKRWSFFAHPP